MNIFICRQDRHKDVSDTQTETFEDCNPNVRGRDSSLFFLDGEFSTLLLSLLLFLAPCIFEAPFCSFVVSFESATTASTSISSYFTLPWIASMNATNWFRSRLLDCPPFVTLCRARSTVLYFKDPLYGIYKQLVNTNSSHCISITPSVVHIS